MIAEVIHTFLISISPFGEARVGIPYGIVQGMHPIWAFVVGLCANLLIFPIFSALIRKFDTRLWRFRVYKKQSLKLARRAKSGVGAQIRKYGFWGLMIFVMIPLPVTGAYMGTIAAHLFKINRRKAAAAISLGVLISCALVTTGTYFGKMGIEEMRTPETSLLPDQGKYSYSMPGSAPSRYHNRTDAGRFPLNTSNMIGMVNPD